MALTVTSVDKLPRATRNKKRSLEDTQEWAELKAKFAEGLRPYEAVYVTFTPDQQRKLGIKTAHRIFLEMAKGYIRKLKLPYDAWKYRSEGQEFVCIAARGVDGSAAPKSMPVAQQQHAGSRAGGKKRKTA